MNENKLSTLQSDLNVDTIAEMSDINNKSKNKNISETDDLENEDVTSPFKSNHNDMTTLSSNESEIKAVNRRSHGKSLFKSIFCCFSSSLHRNHGKSTNQSSKTKNSSFINSTTFNNPCNPITNNDNITNTNNNHNDNTDNSQVSTNNVNNTNGNLTNVNNGNNLNNNDRNNNSNNSSNNNSSNNNYVNIDNSNGFQSNYNYNLSYPSYKDTYQQQERFLLPPVSANDTGKKCLIIDLDETLVHSSFKQVNNADFIVPVEIDGMIHQVYVLKRPFVDEFLKKMGQLYECVLFTASLAKYADPVADLLDKWGVFRYRLFREACVYYRGNYVKDLSRLGRDLNKVIILDNSPASYIFHPNNAVPCISWFDDMNDTELNDLIPYFERLANVDSVYSILKQSNTNSINNSLNNQNNSIIQHQSVVLASNYVHSQVNSYDENQPNPMQNQSIIYQVQNTVTSNKTDENDLIQTSQSPTNTNYNYLLNENKILLSIDLMMATKQQQLQQQQLDQENTQIKEEEKIQE